MSSGRSGPGVGRYATIASLFVTCRWCPPGTQLAFLSPRQTESGLAGRDRRIPEPPSGPAVFTDAPPREEIVLRRARMMKAAALLLAGSLALAACASDEDNGSGGGSEGAGDLKIGLAYDAVGRGDKSF